VRINPPPEIDTGLLGIKIELAEAMGASYVNLPLDMVRAIKARLLAMPARGEEKRPPPPETLVGALQDRIHPTSGKLIRAKKILAALEKKR